MKDWKDCFLVGLISGWSVIASAEPNQPLEVRGDNTVIVDCGDLYSVAYLQHFLLKYVTRQADAEKYAIDYKPRLDRAGSPNFPVVRPGKDIKAPDDKVTILVGSVSRIPKGYLADEVRKRVSESRKGTVVVRREGNVIILAKKTTEQWDLNPIRIFLDKAAGVRMYAPDGADGLEWVSMPEVTHFEIGELDIFMEPFFAKTTFSSGGHKRNATWLRMNTMVSEGSKLRASHTIIRYFSAEKFYKDYPRLFPMLADGTRPKPSGGAWNPCFADPKLSAEIAMKEVRLLMKPKRRAPPDYLSFGVMDCRYICHCEPCKTSLDKHGGDAANLWYSFMNLVARECQKEFPDIYLTSYAYSNVNIPTGMRLESNIVIDNVIKSYRYIDPGYWEAESKSILAFADLGAKWVTHDWNFQAVTPRIYTRQLANFLQWGAQNGMLGIYTEWSGHEYWYLTGAHYWVLRQLLSNPYQDADTLWRQYCQDMFGDGWVEMYRFYDMFQQKFVVGDKYYTRADWPRYDCNAFLAKDVAWQRKWLETAISKTKESLMIQKRLGAVMRYFNAHELLVRATARPGRLYHQFTRLGKKDGINEEALAFYVNDDGSRLLEFERYYDEERTRSPDSNEEDRNSSIRFSYRNNYARALGTIIQAVKARAFKGIDWNRATSETVYEVQANARRIYRSKLPKKRKLRRAGVIEDLMEKVLWVPRIPEMPEFDGSLEDGIWKQAAKLSGWTQADLLLPSVDGNETFGRLMRVGDHLVIGLECQQPKGIWAETTPDVHTGTRIWREASCEVFFGPPVKEGQKQEYMQYIVNSLGAFRGFRKSQDNRKDVHCAVRVAGDGKSYTIEAAFPLKVEGQYDYSKGKVFTFNVMRNPFYANTFNSKERIGWAPIFFTAGVPESRGLIILE